jgi:nucleotide-binding universal stress UspA family protein
MAEQFGARLTGVAAAPAPATMALAAMGEAAVYAAASEAAAESRQAAQELFERLTFGRASRRAWRAGEGAPAEVIAAEAGCADLVVVGPDNPYDQDGAIYRLSAADVILSCRRPVMVVPTKAPAAFRGDRVLLAWTSAPEACRAAHDALPILRFADDVILAQVAPRHPTERYELAVEAMAEHLTRHGAMVTVRRVANPGDPAEALLQVADDSHCDMIVAGAYGHSRFREWVLGGVTRTLLQKSPLPCLLSH